MPIKGLSESRRLPRIGKVYLGFKATKGNTEYPVELPFFRLPDDSRLKPYCFKDAQTAVERAIELEYKRDNGLNYIRKNFHLLAEELTIRLPIDDPERVFPQYYSMFGKGRGLICRGDGERATQNVGGEMRERNCPCEHLKTDENEKGECTPRGRLFFALDATGIGGYYELGVGSINSIIDINSGIDAARAIVGRVAFVPMTLRRIMTETHHDEKRQIHYTCQLVVEVPINELETLRRDSDRILTHNRNLAIEYIEDEDPREVEPADIAEYEEIDYYGEMLALLEGAANLDTLADVYHSIDASQLTEVQKKELARVKDEMKERLS